MSYKIKCIKSICKKKHKRDTRKILGYALYYWDLVRFKYIWTYAKYNDAKNELNKLITNEIN